MNKPSPDADLLRRAATHARETANAATEGPWKTHDTHLGSGGHSATVLTDRDKILRIVADWVDAAARTAVTDVGDLIEDLRRAGYKLPEPTEHPKEN